MGMKHKHKGVNETVAGAVAIGQAAGPGKGTKSMAEGGAKMGTEAGMETAARATEGGKWWLLVQR